MRIPRRGVTLLELIVVLLIIGGMLAFLFPALQRGREAARGASCKSNLHQLSLAMAQYWHLRKKVPEPAKADTVGGWAIAVLPFMEDPLLADRLAGNPRIDQPAIAEYMRRRPFIMTCPSAWAGDSSVPGIPASHYAMGTNSSRNYFVLREVATSSRVPWVQSPELSSGSYLRDLGPHGGSYYSADSEGDVRLVDGTVN